MFGRERAGNAERRTVTTYGPNPASLELIAGLFGARLGRARPVVGLEGSPRGSFRGYVRPVHDFANVASPANLATLRHSMNNSRLPAGSPPITEPISPALASLAGRAAL